MDGPILVTGGTGRLGRPLVTRLLADEAPVRVMSRRPRPAGDDRPYEWAQADLGRDAGVDAAVRGAGTIVHCATGARDVELTRRLMRAVRAAGAEGEAPHVVLISIVGIDDVPFPYYRSKLASEGLVVSSGLPWTLLRATQFHDLIATLVTAQRRLPAVLAPRGFRFQPVAASDVAVRLAELAQAKPAGRVPDMGGPQARPLRELAETVMLAGGWERRVVEPALPGRAARAVAAGALLTPADRAVGTLTFEQHLGV
ncbi:NAD-dependent epimerase/dehydratase family protein [Streptomyces sp. RKND-216]|uniref:SDR family oxidoreductase n=1 Tax=Streptomyces sp. RKND-216 TaxID=2562581 RepID=UPI00109DE40C|nr:NAD(P)H-binding protein [Streptomyces sp. RKND-216]THA24397.1 NAD-dependent epimerase/dehydratase family protein [Streptomyces sp. RKND-216]